MSSQHLLNIPFLNRVYSLGKLDVQDDLILYIILVLHENFLNFNKMNENSLKT